MSIAFETSDILKLFTHASDLSLRIPHRNMGHMFEHVKGVSMTRRIPEDRVDDIDKSRKSLRNRINVAFFLLNVELTVYNFCFF